MLQAVRDARFRDGVFCPRCNHRDVQLWGTFSGRQRYRCKNCERTFSDLTGTPAAYLKKIELLPTYCGGLARQLSIRCVALQLGIHPSTAFRWRHRLLDGLHEYDTDTLSGWVELGSFWLPESHKGQRRLGPSAGRTPRQRGRDRWNLFHEGRRVYVAVACDRAGRVASGLYPDPTKAGLPHHALDIALLGRLERLTPLRLTATYPTRGAARGFAGRIGATYYDAFLERGRPPPPWRARRSGRTLRVEHSLAHVGTVGPYIRRLREWLRAFRGVATRYLPNYLLWHRLVDADVRNRFQSLLLRWPHPPTVTL